MALLPLRLRMLECSIFSPAPAHWAWRPFHAVPASANSSMIVRKRALSSGGMPMRSVVEGGWLAKDGTAVLEESTKSEIGMPEGMRQVDERVYGDTKVL